MRWLHGVFALIFVLFATVQYNDPDPFRWILLYGAVAVSFAASALGWPLGRYVSGAAAVLGCIYLIPLLPDCWHWIAAGMPSIVTTMKADTPWVELVREALGAFLSVLSSGWLWWRWWR
jgi:hypothetical protein